MTRTGFVVANLFRKKTRTILTLLSVVMAFTLFGLLQSLNHIFDAGADFIGVAHVAHMQWFGGVWKRDNAQIFAFSVDPRRQHIVYPEWVMPEQQWEAFA